MLCLSGFELYSRWVPLTPDPVLSLNKILVTLVWFVRVLITQRVFFRNDLKTHVRLRCFRKKNFIYPYFEALLGSTTLFGLHAMLLNYGSVLSRSYVLDNRHKYRTNILNHKGLQSECADILHQSFLCCCAILTSPKKGETAVYGYNPALF